MTLPNGPKATMIDPYKAGILISSQQYPEPSYTVYITSGTMIGQTVTIPPYALIALSANPTPQRAKPVI